MRSSTVIAHWQWQITPRIATYVTGFVRYSVLGLYWRLDHYALRNWLDKLFDMAVARNEISWFQNLTPFLVVCNLLTGQNGTCKVGYIDFDISSLPALVHDVNCI